MSGNLARRDIDTPTLSGDHRPTRAEQRTMSRIEGRGAIERLDDTEQARRVGNRIDLHAALAIHTMGRAVEVIQARRDLAKGDPDIDLELLVFQRTAFHRMQALQSGLFEPLG